MSSLQLIVITRCFGTIAFITCPLNDTARPQGDPQTRISLRATPTRQLNVIEFNHLTYTHTLLHRFLFEVVLYINFPSRTPTNLASPTSTALHLDKMAKIKTVERFRVKPRWMFVKITDEEGNVGWGEATLEGHDLAVEGALDEIIVRIKGLEAK